MNKKKRRKREKKRERKKRNKRKHEFIKSLSPGQCDPGTRRDARWGRGYLPGQAACFSLNRHKARYQKEVPAAAINHPAVLKALVNPQPGQPGTIYGITYVGNRLF